MISQYDPSARLVVKVVLHAESSLLMATNPADPAIFVYIKNNRQKETHASTKSDSIGLRRDPVSYSRRANGIAETCHSSYSYPSVLAEPSILAAYSSAWTKA